MEVQLLQQDKSLFMKYGRENKDYIFLERTWLHSHYRGALLHHSWITRLETGSWPALRDAGGMSLCNGNRREFQSRLTLLLTSVRGKMFLGILSGLAEL